MLLFLTPAFCEAEKICVICEICLPAGKVCGKKVAKQLLLCAFASLWLTCFAQQSFQKLPNSFKQLQNLKYQPHLKSKM